MFVTPGSLCRTPSLSTDYLSLTQYDGCGPSGIPDHKSLFWCRIWAGRCRNRNGSTAEIKSVWFDPAAKKLPDQLGGSELGQELPLAVALDLQPSVQAHAAS
ncbi:Hypothetical predicted protein [Octopus vulgaris]|uniref:Uncharacterized protein n=1 Tax=Octopus vulgaris TaxID=6645 RepID=A0AA36FK68_OCTVU|nr:Hypothetical predicted protein [Octopus vulgaris]